MAKTDKKDGVRKSIQLRPKTVGSRREILEAEPLSLVHGMSSKEALSPVMPDVAVA